MMIDVDALTSDCLYALVVWNITYCCSLSFLQNDFNFEKRDWMKVGPDELPAGSKLVGNNSF